MLVSTEAIKAKLLSMQEREREGIYSQVGSGISQCFVPSPGPQTEAYYSEADILLYGGEAGGGKTSLINGLALTAHNRSLIMRRQYTDLSPVIDDCLRLYGSRDGYNGSSPPSLKTSDGRFIQFGAVSQIGDEENWKGNPHDLKCVGKDTRVLMADGSYKAIQDIVIGDEVMTLGGGRRVTRILPVRYDEACEIEINGRRQIQSLTHDFLTSSGWESSASLCASCESSEYYSAYKSLSWSCRTFCTRFAPLSFLYSYLGRILAPLRLRLGNQFYAAKISLCELLNAESGYGLFARVFLGRARRFLYPLFSKARQAFLHLPASLLFRPLFSRGDICVRALSSLPNYLKNCLAYSRLYGGRIQPVENSSTAPIYALLYPIQSSYVAPPIPSHSGDADIGLEHTHICTHCLCKYPHPYTKEIHLSEQHLVSSSFSITPIGKVDLYDITVDELNHFITDSGIINKNCYDEVVDFAEQQVRFIMGWNRSVIPNQRCRVVMASNPPTNSSGDWIVGMFRPWLDITHHNPAKSGELRWYITDRDGKDVEVDGPEPREDGYDGSGKIRILTPKSRTFIRSSLRDNPYLVNTDYQATLDAMPEPYRSAYRDGNFMLARKDDETQLIPTAWIREAQNRWTATLPKGVPMCAMGVDPAAGGGDETVIATRYDGYYPELITCPGAETPYPQDVAAKVMRYRRDEAIPIIDCGGGYGGGVVRHLEDNGIKSIAHKGVEKSAKRTRDRLHPFASKRAEVFYRFREALDPSQPGGSTIILPPDQKLLSDLCAVRYQITSKGIQLESKDDMKKRLGRSPDRGDAVVMAWSGGDTVASKKDGVWSYGKNKLPKAIMGYTNRRR